MAYIGNSIVDYLKSVGQDSSYSARAALAVKYGIKNYTGQADENIKLLNLLNKTTTTTPAATVAPVVTAPPTYVTPEKQQPTYVTRAAIDTTSKYIQDPNNAYASIPNPNYIAPSVTQTPSTTPVVNPTVVPQTNTNALLQLVRDEQQKRIDHPELYDASGKLKSTIPTAPEVKDVSFNVPSVGLTIPTLTTPTAVENSSDLITSLTTQLTQANEALQASYKTQLDKIASDKLATQAKIDAITSKEETALGEVKTLTQPFREELENAERERLYINENFEANQTLTNELDGLLTEGNALISQLKGTTGLTSIRNPRINEAIDAVNARAGVISAVINARNSQINQAYAMIDRTTAAITSDKNDQLSYYNALLSFYDKSKTTEGNKLITLNTDEKTYINAKIATLESDVARIQKTSDAVKDALINPNTALLYAKAGVTLNDSIEEINTKLAKQTYANEVINTANTMATNGYTQVVTGTTIPFGYESMTTYDSQGIGTTWIRKKTATEDANIGKTVTVNNKVYQYNPNTGLYDIPVGDTGASKVDVENQIISAQSDIDTMKAILNSDLPGVGPTWFTIPGIGADVAPGRIDIWSKLSGDTQKFIGQVEQIVNSKTLDAFTEAKKNGATFGSMSDSEWAILSSAATKVGTWRIKDKNGKVVGYDIDQETFRNEISGLLNAVEKAKKDLESQYITPNVNVQYNADGSVKDLNF